MDKYGEDAHFALFVSGPQEPESWRRKPAEPDYYVIRSFVDRLLEKAGLPESRLQKQELTESDVFSAGMVYMLGRDEVVRFGEIQSALLDKFEVEQGVFFAEIRLEPLLKIRKSLRVKYHEMPRYPAVRRDLALLLDKEVRFEDIRALAFRTEKKLLREVNVFDVFTDPRLGENKKSYAVSFVLQDPERTLTDKQIDKVMKRLMQAYEKEMEAKIR